MTTFFKTSVHFKDYKVLSATTVLQYSAFGNCEKISEYFNLIKSLPLCCYLKEYHQENYHFNINYSPSATFNVLHA